MINELEELIYEERWRELTRYGMAKLKRKKEKIEMKNIFLYKDRTLH